MRKQIDPKDFMLDSKNGEVIIRMPGSINGMQFIIQNLEVSKYINMTHLNQFN